MRKIEKERIISEKKFGTVFLIIMMCVVLFSGCFSKNSSDADGTASDLQKLTLRIGHSEPSDSIRETAVQIMAKKVAELSDNITIQSFPAGQLGSLPAMVEQAQTNSLDMVCLAPAILQTYDPNQNIGVIQLPYLFDTYKQAWAMMDDEGVIDELFGDLPQNNIRLISIWESGFRHITNSRRPITSIEDLKGTKLRVVQSPLSQSIIKNLGASPVPMAFNELYTALQSKVLDGQENPLSVIFASKFNEVQPYLTLTRHQYEPVCLIISESTWSKLSDNEKAALEAGATEAQKFIRNAVVEQEQEWLAELKSKGMDVVEQFDIEPFRNASKQTYKDMAEELYGEELVNKIVTKAAQIRTQNP